VVIDDLEVRLALHHQSQDAGHTTQGGGIAGQFPATLLLDGRMQGLSLPLRARVCTARCTARCAVLAGVGLRREGKGKAAVNSHVAPMGRR